MKSMNVLIAVLKRRRLEMCEHKILTWAYPYNQDYLFCSFCDKAIPIKEMIEKWREMINERN